MKSQSIYLSAHQTVFSLRVVPQALTVIDFGSAVRVISMLQDDLISNVVLPHLCHSDVDDDVKVRKFSVEILLSLAQSCSAQNFMDIIIVIEKVRLLVNLFMLFSMFGL